MSSLWRACSHRKARILGITIYAIADCSPVGAMINLYTGRAGPLRLDPSGWDRVDTNGLITVVGYIIIGRFHRRPLVPLERRGNDRGEHVAQDEPEPPTEPEGLPGKKGRPWFRRNRFGPGWHPSSWQGGLILALTVAAITTVIVLFRTGVL